MKIATDEQTNSFGKMVDIVNGKNLYWQLSFHDSCPLIRIISYDKETRMGQFVLEDIISLY